MEGDQIGGCCSSLDKNLRGLGPRRLTVVIDRNGWIQVMLKRSRQQGILMDWAWEVKEREESRGLVILDGI